MLFLRIEKNISLFNRRKYWLKCAKLLSRILKIYSKKELFLNRVFFKLSTLKKLVKFLRFSFWVNGFHFLIISIPRKTHFFFE